MTSFKVHVVFVVPADEEDIAVEIINDILDAGELEVSESVDWDITEVWEYDDEEDDEDLVD